MTGRSARVIPVLLVAVLLTLVHASVPAWAAGLAVSGSTITVHTVRPTAAETPVEVSP